MILDTYSTAHSVFVQLNSIRKYTYYAPHTNVNIQRLEAVQRHAARFCFNNISPYPSVTNMLESLDLQSLQTRSNIAKLIIMYKIINRNLHISSNSLIPNQRNSRRGYLTQLQTRVDS